MFGLSAATRIYIALDAVDMTRDSTTERIAAILTVVESCRRLKIPVRDLSAGRAAWPCSAQAAGDPFADSLTLGERTVLTWDGYTHTLK